MHLALRHPLRRRGITNGKVIKCSAITLVIAFLPRRQFLARSTTHIFLSIFEVRLAYDFTFTCHMPALFYSGGFNSVLNFFEEVDENLTLPGV